MRCSEYPQEVSFRRHVDYCIIYEDRVKLPRQVEIPHICRTEFAFRIQFPGVGKHGLADVDPCYLKVPLKMKDILSAAASHVQQSADFDLGMFFYEPGKKLALFPVNLNVLPYRPEPGKIFIQAVDIFSHNLLPLPKRFRLTLIMKKELRIFPFQVVSDASVLGFILKDLS